MSAIFKIEPGKEVTTTTEKVVKPASFYFMVKRDGQPIKPKRDGCVYQDGTQLSMSNWTCIAKNYVRFERFGTTTAKSDDESRALMELKDRLPSLFTALAHAMTKSNDEPPAGTVDLATGSTLKASEGNLEILYKFEDQVVEHVSDKKTEPSRIFFNCTSIPTTTVVGIAGNLGIEYGQWGYGHNLFQFKHNGWLTIGVDRMRAAHSDETIEAAFQDLARNLLACPPPDGAKTWRLVEQTSLQLTE